MWGFLLDFSHETQYAKYFVKIFTQTSLNEVTENGAVLVTKRCGCRNRRCQSCSDGIKG
jgi:hypothetical protein